MRLKDPNFILAIFRLYAVRMRCLLDHDSYQRSVPGGDGAAGLADMDQVAMLNFLACVGRKHDGSEVETRWSGMAVSIEDSEILKASPVVRYGSILWTCYRVFRLTLSCIGSLPDYQCWRHMRDPLRSFCRARWMLEAMLRS